MKVKKPMCCTYPTGKGNLTVYHYPCLKRSCGGNRNAGKVLGYLLYHASQDDYVQRGQDDQGRETLMLAVATTRIAEDLDDEVCERTIADDVIPCLEELGYLTAEFVRGARQYTRFTLTPALIQAGIDHPEQVPPFTSLDYYTALRQRRHEKWIATCQRKAVQVAEETSRPETIPVAPETIPVGTPKSTGNNSSRTGNNSSRESGTEAASEAAGVPLSDGDKDSSQDPDRNKNQERDGGASPTSDTPPDGGLTPASPSLPSSASPSAPSYSHNRLYAAQQGGTVSSPAGGVPPPTPAPSVIAGNPPQGNGNPGATGYRKLPTQGQEDGVESATRESRPPGQAAPGAASPSSAAAAGTKSGGQDGVSPPTPTTVRRYPKKRETPWPGPYLCDPDLLRGLIDADRGSELDAGVNFTEMELCRQWGTSHPEEHYHRIMAHIRQGTCKTHAWWKDKLDFWRAQKLLDVTGPILTELGLLKKPAPPPGASPPPDIAVPAHEAPAPARPRYDPYGDLPPAVAEALRQRDAERRLIGSGGVPPSGNGHAPPRRADSTSPPPEGERVVTLAVVAASSAGSSPHVGAGARGEARS